MLLDNETQKHKKHSNIKQKEKLNRLLSQIHTIHYIQNTNTI
jgi:hypothetical protein